MNKREVKGKNCLATKFSRADFKFNVSAIQLVTNFYKFFSEPKISILHLKVIQYNFQTKKYRLQFADRREGLANHKINFKY